MTNYVYNVTAYSDSGKTTTGTFNFDFTPESEASILTPENIQDLAAGEVELWWYHNFTGSFNVPDITTEQSVAIKGALFSSMAGPNLTWTFAQLSTDPNVRQVGMQYFTNNSTGSVISGGITTRPNTLADIDYWYFMAIPVS